MAGIDHARASVQEREPFAFTQAHVARVLRYVFEQNGIHSAVLLSTCNRCELYLHADEHVLNPARFLFEYLKVDGSQYESLFVIREHEDCVRHLMELAGGLQSRVLGEDQVITQVKQALCMARDSQTLDAYMETLFHSAIACGKTLRSELKVSSVRPSAAHSALDSLHALLGDVKGKAVLVIGNGEMGRLAAQLLHEQGASVSITLRTHGRSESIVPCGCQAESFEERYECMKSADIVISATTSPHYTIVARELSSLPKIPLVMVDLAMPRDIDPTCADFTRVLNVDDLGSHVGLSVAAKQEVEKIIDGSIEKFYKWHNYKTSLPAIDDLKEALSRRLLSQVNDHDSVELQVEFAVKKAVELMCAGFASQISSETVYQCADVIRSRSR